MKTLLFHQLLSSGYQLFPERPALFYKDRCYSYEQVFLSMQSINYWLQQQDLVRGDRIAVYAGKSMEMVASLFACSGAGMVFVPLNPQLKAMQIEHILNDCEPEILITSSQRLQYLLDENLLAGVQHVLLLDKLKFKQCTAVPITEIDRLPAADSNLELNQGIDEFNVSDNDLAAILYTSGSTGMAKGVMISHKNLLLGAQTVCQYLQNHADDRLLALLPFSFDYGLNQLTSAFYCGASVVLLDYLFPQDVIRAISHYKITGLAGVPGFWMQFLKCQWQPRDVASLRYITNSGGVLNAKVVNAFQAALPELQIYLMYGLTEAFRSTYLHPDDLLANPQLVQHQVIGKAIPNVCLYVVNRQQHRACRAGEAGELVHGGGLVSLGYWHNKNASEKVYVPLNQLIDDTGSSEIVVCSGDEVYFDEQGYFYFIRRNSDLIKSSGYRISPHEIEAVFLQQQRVQQAVVIAVADKMLGQAVIVFCVLDDYSIPDSVTQRKMLQKIKQQLPNYMHPKQLIFKTSLPVTANGKIDRQQLQLLYQQS